MHKNTNEKDAGEVLQSIRKTLEEVSEDLYRNVQVEQGVRKEILANSLRLTHQIQDNKHAVEMHMESLQKKRSVDFEDSSEKLERVLLSGDLKDIEDLLKNALQ